jgi:asparagine synthase (glutamine-hydrolysing)
MCGFAGFLSFAPSPHSLESRRELLVAMGLAITHRGPDGVRYYDDGSLALVFRRLAIIDVRGGDQPFFNESHSLVGVVNGEIYNHAPLRRELESRHRFSTRSDCEVVLHGYEDWGSATLDRLRGMFAMAIWDREKKQLFLARDRLGIKPLYICRIADGLLFASELKALLMHPGCPRGLDWGVVGRDLIVQRPTSTYVQGVELLPGGEFLNVASDGASTGGRYWSLDEHLGTAPYGLDSAAYRTHYRELLEQTTKEHLQSDVQVGLQLSGGLDSSLLAAIIAQERTDIPCFTVVERTTYRAGDVNGARGVAEQLGLPWYPVLFDYRSLLDDIGFDLGQLERSVWMMDAPRFDLEWLLKSELNRFARASYPGLKVLISGQGADEFSGGYSRRADRMHSSWADYLEQEVAQNLLRELSSDRGISLEVAQLLQPADTFGVRPVGQYHRMMRLMIRTLQHHNLWHEDRTSSWHGMEARVPFLDHRIVELLASVPEALHESLFWNKQIVRDAMRHFLPHYDLNRPKVGFFDTDDTRSVDLIVYGMATRIAPAFLEKYADAPDFLFNRERIGELTHRVATRASCHFENAKRLMECMVISIFERQCRSPEALMLVDSRSSPPPLKAVQSTEWAAVDASMSASPELPLAWVMSNGVGLPPGAMVMTNLSGDQDSRYVLMLDGKVVSQISMSSRHPWLGRFLEGIGKAAAADFSLSDWIDELDVTPREFRKTLNALHQVGFVAPVALPGAAQRLQGVIPLDNYAKRLA